MFEQGLGMTIIVFLVGLVLGIILTLLTNKIRSGRASPSTIKREMEDYQGQVEAHFDQTSEKFKQMASQYQDLYKHLSVGATTLCRPENISPGLVADKDPLSPNLGLDKKTSTDSKAKSDMPTAQQAETDSKIKADLEKLKADQAKVKPEAKVEVQAKPVVEKQAKPVADKVADAIKKA